MKYIAILFALIIPAFLVNPLLAQDSTRIQLPDSIRYAAFDTNVIKGTNRLSNTSDVFSYNEYIWSDKRSLSEIMEMRNGYFINNLGFGERNPINFLGFNNSYIGIFKDGIQMNDFIFDGFDVENISINEIDSIEEVSPLHSFLYGTNAGVRAINVITKDIIQPEPFSQFRYSQDRYNSLFADIYFSQSFSKKFNVQIGVTKYSSDGRFTNSEFDKWQTRTKLNFYLNPSFNIKASFYYNKIDRGLFGGLIDTVNIENISNDNQRVVNATTNDTWTNFYANFLISAKLFKNKNDVTKLIFSYQNMRRQVSDSISSNNNYFLHGLKFLTNLDQKIGIINNKMIKYDIDFKAKYEITKLNGGPYIVWPLDNSFSLGTINQLKINNLEIDGFLEFSNSKKKYFTTEKIFNLSDDNKNYAYLSGGIEANYKFIYTENSHFKLNGGFNIYSQNNWQGFYKNYNTLGIEYRYNMFSIRVNGFYINDVYIPKNISYDFRKNSYGISGFARYKIYDVVINLDFHSVDNLKRWSHFLKGNIFYENKFFNNNLDFKTGFIIKKYYNFDLYAYNMNGNYIYINNRDNIPPFLNQNLFNADFYIGARIGSANINFTLANLLNRFNYDTYLYPYDDRGGFANVVSRFTIVWDFLN